MILKGRKQDKSELKEDMSSKVFDTSRLEAPKDLKDAEDRLPQMKQDPKSSVNFTGITSRSYPEGATAQEITKYSIDLSYKLDVFIDTQRNKIKSLDESNTSVNRHVLGELQFAFVCFLVGNAIDGFEQWKSMINLLCNSETSIRTRPDLFLGLLNVIYYQLNEMPIDFFTDIITSNNFLVVQLHNLFDNVRDACGCGGELFEKMGRRCEQLKNYLQEKFKFDFDEEPDEYAPVICDDE